MALASCFLPSLTHKISTPFAAPELWQRSQRSAMAICSHAKENAGAAIQRRELVTTVLSILTLTCSPFSARSETNEYQLYEDFVQGYSINVPQDWMQAEGKGTGQRKVTAFLPPNEGFANVNVIITGLGADYTGLGSLGSVDVFAENLVNTLDRSWKNPPGQAARLVDAYAKNGMYYVEYTIQSPGESRRHLLSVVGIGSNGWINQLYTVTGQFLEEQNYKDAIQQVINSFKVIRRT